MFLFSFTKKKQSQAGLVNEKTPLEIMIFAIKEFYINQLAQPEF